MLAAWKTPHSFALLPVEGESPTLPPMPAFTYGPLAADLTALAHPSLDVVTRLGRSLGYEWLSATVDASRSAAELGPSQLSEYLQETHELHPESAPNPFAVRRGKLVRKRGIRAVPTELLSDFVSKEQGRLAEVGTTIGYLVGPLLAVATGGAWEDVYEQPERAAVLFNALEPPVKLQRLYEPASETWIHVLECPNLYARALIEIVELYNDRPRLAICARCERLFVPRRPSDKYCRRYTWPAGSGEPIAGCIFDEVPSVRRVDLDSRARRREYARFQMRVSRREKAYGSEHPTTVQARHAFDVWKAANPAPRGRRPNPIDLEHLPEPLLPDPDPARPVRAKQVRPRSNPVWASQCHKS